MGDVTELRPGIRLSISQVADEFGMSRNTVSRRIADCGIKPDGRRGGYPVYRLRDLMPALQVERQGDGADAQDPDKMTPTDRKAHYQAAREKVKWMAECGQLIPAEEVHEQMGKIAKAVKRALITLPDQAERDKRCDPDMVAYLDKKVRAALKELAAELAAADEEESGVREGQ